MCEQQLAKISIYTIQYCCEFIKRVLLYKVVLLITKLTRQVRIINTYSTYRTSTICPHSATFPFKPHLLPSSISDLHDGSHLVGSHDGIPGSSTRVESIRSRGSWDRKKLLSNKTEIKSQQCLNTLV